MLTTVRKRFSLRNLLILLINSYALGLTIYLLLRLAFGDRFWPLNLLNNFVPFYFLPLFVLLPLAFILRSHRTFALTLILATIGAAWIGPRFIPRAYAGVSGTTLKVLTFNVWGNDHDLSEKEAWIRQVNADVVLLQEISPTYARERLSNLQDIYPYQFSQPDDSRWGGNITLSRYPIVVMDYVDLHVRNNPVPQRIIIDVNGREIAVYNAHMAWPASHPRLPIPRRLNNLYVQVVLGFNDRLRNAQIRRFLELIDQEQRPFIVGGDFNTSDYSLMYSEIASHMRDSFAEAGYGLGGSWPNSAARGLPAFIPPLVRIDYIWHSDDFYATYAEQGPRLESDHIPLIAELVLDN